jgi:hypothetical protein
MADTLVVPTRFRGPLDSGNGGWVSAKIASHVDGDAEVTLRRPPPLEKPMRIETDPTGVQVLDGDELVATARPTSLSVEPPRAVSPDDARRVPGTYGGEGVVGECFSCGRDREPGDGLCLYTGEVEGRPETLAAHWSPHESLGNSDGTVPEPVVWAALDCPSGWVHIRHGELALLGRIAARVTGVVRVGADYAVVAAPTGVDGRKQHSVSAIYDDAGAVLALARATWVQIGEPSQR